MNRREVLAALGVASGQTLLWALGCGPGVRAPQGPIEAGGGEVRSWLRDAVERLAGAGLAEPYAIAVRRRRTTAAIDVLGAGVARARADGVVLGARDRDGALREQVTSELGAAGIAAAAAALAGTARPARVAFGEPRVWDDGEGEPGDAALLDAVARIGPRDAALSSRIVYRAELVDIDDAHVWSVAAGRDLEQRLVRVRQAATRVAWNGTRPVIAEAARAWTGKLGAQELTAAELEDATRGALALMTPTAFPDGEHAVVLAPPIVARLLDAAVTALFTTAAARRPEVARRIAPGAQLAAAPVTLVDDPTAPAAYGGFHFDDEGELAAPVTLVEAGRVAGRLADRAGVAARLAASPGRGRRAGHDGPVAPAASHLRLLPGRADRGALLDDGFVLEGDATALVDPGGERVVLTVARARELSAGQETGRVFADIELVGELAALLGSIAAASSQTQTFGLRDELDGRPRWRSIEAPWLRAKGLVRARRRPA